MCVLYSWGVQNVGGVNYSRCHLEYSGELSWVQWGMISTVKDITMYEGKDINLNNSFPLFSVENPVVLNTPYCTPDILPHIYGINALHWTSSTVLKIASPFPQFNPHPTGTPSGVLSNHCTTYTWADSSEVKSIYWTSSLSREATKEVFLQGTYALKASLLKFKLYPLDNKRIFLHIGCQKLPTFSCIKGLDNYKELFDD